ncbi:MAG: acyl-CoA dehydrogenase family protein [Blastomonas sp.]
MGRTAFGSLGYSEEQVELMDVATAFCRERSPIDRVRGLIVEDRGFDPAIWQEIADLGWLGIAIAEEFGGVGLGMAEVVPVAEQMGRTLMAGPFAACTIAAQILMAAGSDAQKAEWLPRIVAGEIVVPALVEADCGWNLAGNSAHAEGGQLAGQKCFVPHADAAAAILVALDGNFAIVERAAIGEHALRRETIIDETRRTFALSLDGIALGDEALMQADRFAAALEQAELCALLLQAAEMCGGAQAVIDYTLDYLRTRKQFGKLIGEYQALKHPIADAYVAYENARSHLYAAAHSFGDQGQGEIATRMAKASADKAYAFAADRAIQFHGGFGFTHDCDAGLHRRAAIWQASQFGDAAWQRACLADLILS